MKKTVRTAKMMKEYSLMAACKQEKDGFYFGQSRPLAASHGQPQFFNEE
jgi:hypothetical protein